jgi:hypothetical protein
MNEIIPDNIVVPIFGIKADNSLDTFLGTGAFVENGDFLITAHHVIKNWHERYAILIAEKQRMYETIVVLESPETDLAVLRVDGYRPSYSFPLAKPEDFRFNIPVVCLEYGTTQKLGQKFYVEPATRLGNITRIRNLTDKFNLAGDEALELSFPALRGASGAAIIHWAPPFMLFGIVIANVNYHLMPSQVESVLDESNQMYEEIKYMLPQALAVNVKHISKLISELQKPQG